MGDCVIVHCVISGRVQGVGFRAWARREAVLRGLEGWVRNRMNGTVEAVFAGEDAAVEAMIAACRTGPAGARVDRVDQRPATAGALAQRVGASGFEQLPTI